MWDSKQIKKLNTGDRVTFGNGFIAKCNKDNSVSLILQQRQAGTRQTSKVRTYSLAKVDKLDKRLDNLIDQAMQTAMEYRVMLRDGKDPQAVIQKEEEVKQSQALTFKEACELYDMDSLRHDNNVENTVKKRNSIWNSTVKDWLDNDKKISDIDTKAIYNRWAEISSGQDKRGKNGEGRKRTAQLFYVWTRALFNFLIDTDQWIGKNPCDKLRKRVKTKANASKNNFFIPSETSNLIRLLKSYTALKNKELSFAGKIVKQSTMYRIQQFNMIHFLLITGLRKSEAFKIERKNIHLNGTELHNEPYFTLTTTKQKEEYAIAITKELRRVIDFQYNLVGGDDAPIKNMADINKDFLRHDNTDYKGQNSTERSKAKTTVTEPKYLFLNENDLIQALTRKRQWENKENTSLDSAFDIIKKEMPKNMYVTSISPNTLRHTFSSFGFMLGYTDLEIDVMTAHARKNSKSAGQVYIARVVNTHRKDFELIQDAMLGKSISDKDFIARQDATSKKLEGASEEEILALYNKGLLTSAEERKYKVWELQKRELDKIV